jgi:hypothetical protein
MKTLDEIAKITGTDKSSDIHNYCVKYEKYLPFERTQPLRILEVGVLTGKSLGMWSAFYENAECVVGIDINPQCKQYENSAKNIFIEIGSQNDETFLSTVKQKYKSFDLIIDDGSHMQDHMVFTFKSLFNALKSGGVYIVEDTCCAYWPNYGGSPDASNSSISYLKSLIDHVNYFGRTLNNSSEGHYRRDDLHIKQIEAGQLNIRTDIESINFMNSTVLVTKR